MGFHNLLSLYNTASKIKWTMIRWLDQYEVKGKHNFGKWKKEEKTTWERYINMGDNIKMEQYYSVGRMKVTQGTIQLLALC